MGAASEDLRGKFFDPTDCLARYPNLQFRKNHPVTVDQMIELYIDAGLNRPVEDKERMAEALANSNLTLSAWDGDLLVGFARSLTDFVYCTYVSDLAIRKAYQKGGIGRELLRRTKEIVGERSMLFLLAAPSAVQYYPRIGMEPIDNGFIVKREF